MCHQDVRSLCAKFLILTTDVYLLDTNVVSELRRIRPHGAVTAWVASVPNEQMFISAVTAGEIETGIVRTRPRDEGRADELTSWLDEVVTTFSVIPVDARTFRLWANLMHRKSQAVFLDAMIAATAIVNGLTVATRNVRDFEQFGVEIFNPFEGS